MLANSLAGSGFFDEGSRYSRLYPKTSQSAPSKGVRMKSSILMLSAVSLAVVLSGTGPVESKTRKESSFSQHIRNDKQQDLPMPHPSSRRFSGRTHNYHPGAYTGRPQDISGGNGQKLTRQRRF